MAFIWFSMLAESCVVEGPGLDGGGWSQVACGGASVGYVVVCCQCASAHFGTVPRQHTMKANTHRGWSVRMMLVIKLNVVCQACH